MAEKAPKPASDEIQDNGTIKRKQRGNKKEEDTRKSVQVQGVH